MTRFTGHSKRERDAMRFNFDRFIKDTNRRIDKMENAKYDVLRPGSDAARLQGYINYRQKKVADEAHKRAMALEGLKQSGQTERTGMTARGQMYIKPYMSHFVVKGNNGILF